MPGRIFDEPSGVFTGTLQEDAIDTYRKTKRPFIDVIVSELWSKDVDYPLTYVPVWHRTSLLKKGDKVRIKFNQHLSPYPELYKSVEFSPDFLKLLEDMDSAIDLGEGNTIKADKDKVYIKLNDIEAEVGDIEASLGKLEVDGKDAKLQFMDTSLETKGFKLDNLGGCKVTSNGMELVSNIIEALVTALDASFQVPTSIDGANGNLKKAWDGASPTVKAAITLFKGI
jgi:hypothetical protein